MTRSKTLNEFQEFVLVLVILRLNLPNQDLAIRFEISLSFFFLFFSSWMVVLDVRLSTLISCSEREDLWHTMPVCF